MRRSGGSAAASELPLLQLGHQAADPLCPGKSQEDVRSSRKFARPGRQGAGLSHRSQQLQRLRRGVKEYFKVPPPRTTIGTTGLLVKDTLVEIDLIGVAND